LIDTSRETKIKVSEVASRAGVSHSTIYNRYPYILQKIRSHNEKLLVNRQNLRESLKNLKRDKLSLKQELKDAKSSISKLVSIKASYELENSKLKAKTSDLEEKARSY